MSRLIIAARRLRWLRYSLVLVLATLLTGCGASPLVAPQPPKVNRIGFLANGSAELNPTRDAFIDGLRELGHIEGQNLSVEYRYAEGKPDRLSGLARELAELKPDAIFAGGEAPARAVLEVAPQIPLVITTWDAVAAGLVAQALNRPGRSLTGITCSTVALGPKRLQLLKKAVSTAERVAVVWWPREPANAAEWEALQSAAPGVGVRLVPAPLQGPEDLEPALDAARQGGDALVVVASPLTNTSLSRGRIAELAGRYRLPAVYSFREYAEVGGLMAYGTNLPGMFRRAATHMDKVLRGAKPADLPVEQPTTYDFVVNLKAAQALGISLPQSLLQQATEVIQ